MVAASAAGGLAVDVYAREGCYGNVCGSVERLLGCLPGLCACPCARVHGRKRGSAFCAHGLRLCLCETKKKQKNPTGPVTTWAERSSRDQSPASTVRKVDAGLRR